MLVRNLIQLAWLFSLVFLGSIGFQRGLSAQSFLQQSDESHRSTLTEVQAEIAPTVRRLTPVLNTWIVIAVFVSTSTVTTVLVLVVMSVQNLSQTRQNIDRTKQDAVNDLNKSLSEAQALVNDLQYSIQTSEYKMKTIPFKIISSSHKESE
ncbi:hypothetical protein VB834_09180 [Limnoraphis robusta Tam1]|uniref:Uncharacterized protein n=1 Tax=Limnoraphis robusta CCNP1315 TaxID=3110306 RepID=A0ABU5TXX2_9CYAN|nr:hypothetical protein [Limnoraphis robusta]MEA5519734.1 hypothetical protein [Limnoraphis robusta CCNP1315]MEA5539205.1 hypothetical protein [Limnoraphis robusta Tam1]MEA5544304.1 hypothetical protein [Limnoraphis robusta CCNP1324]